MTPLARSYQNCVWEDLVPRQASVRLYWWTLLSFPINEWFDFRIKKDKGITAFISDCNACKICIPCSTWKCIVDLLVLQGCHFSLVLGISKMDPSGTLFFPIRMMSVHIIRFVSLLWISILFTLVELCILKFLCPLCVFSKTSEKCFSELWCHEL